VLTEGCEGETLEASTSEPRLVRSRDALRLIGGIVALLLLGMSPGAAAHAEQAVVLRVQADGGIVTGAGGRVHCDGRCTTSLERGTVVTLRASAQRYFTFVGWTKGCIGAAPTCAIALDSPANVRASFERNTTAVSVSVGGPGNVVSDPAGISCGTTHRVCEASFGAGTEVKLQAEADPDGSFASWSAGCSLVQASRCTLQLDESPAHASVTFGGQAPAVGSPTLTVTTTGTFGPHPPAGSIVSTPAGIDCPPTCSATFSPATPVTLISKFSRTSWTGACIGSGPCALKLDQSARVVADISLGVFAPPPSSTLGVSVSVSGKGRVTAEGIRCGGTTGTLLDCEASYPSRTHVLLRATPGRRSRFAGWRGFCTGKRVTCKLVVAAAMTVEAVFRD
jgi:hypothetical protein